jgi:hypothetical protein
VKCSCAGRDTSSTRRLDEFKLKLNAVPTLTYLFSVIPFLLLKRKRLLHAIATTQPAPFSPCCALISRNCRKRISQSRLLSLQRSSASLVRFCMMNVERFRKFLRVLISEFFNDSSCNSLHHWPAPAQPLQTVQKLAADADDGCFPVTPRKFPVTTRFAPCSFPVTISGGSHFGPVFTWTWTRSAHSVRQNSLYISLLRGIWPERRVSSRLHPPAGKHSAPSHRHSAPGKNSRDYFFAGVMSVTGKSQCASRISNLRCSSRL